MARHADVTFVDISNIVNDPSVPNIEDLVEDPESFVCGFMINGSLYPVSQRTAGEDGKYRSLRIESKRDIRLFVEVMQGASHGSFPDAQLPWCLFKALKAKTLELIFRTGRYQQDGTWKSPRKGQRLCGPEGGAVGWRPFCPTTVPGYEH